MTACNDNLPLGLRRMADEAAWDPSPATVGRLSAEARSAFGPDGEDAVMRAARDAEESLLASWG